jgi:hypothetical protein
MTAPPDISAVLPAIEWQGCYDDSWAGMIVPEAFAHPAKFARGLIGRVIRHGLERGYWHVGETVSDPFGGVALGGIVAAYHGLRWIGVELEPKFVELGNANIALHAAKLAKLGAPLPVIVQGDSRFFNEIAGPLAAAVTSPPYAPNIKSDRHVEDENGMDRDERRGARQGKGCFRGSECYGQAPGQIGHCPAGNLDAVCTSPPWEDQEPSHAQNDTPSKRALLKNPKFHGGQFIGSTYGSSEGQIGQASDETYWQAVDAVYRSVFAALKPGGVLVVVTKGYVKNKAIVDLPGQTEALLRHIGFKPLERVHAMLVKEHRTDGLFGEIRKTKERKSFFRMLCEKQGSPKIDFETVFFFRKRKVLTGGSQGSTPRVMNKYCIECRQPLKGHGTPDASRAAGRRKPSACRQRRKHGQATTPWRLDSAPPGRGYGHGSRPIAGADSARGGERAAWRKLYNQSRGADLVAPKCDLRKHTKAGAQLRLL